MKCQKPCQKEIDQVFVALVLPNITYGLPVYGTSVSDLSIVQRFLDRCHKRRYISKHYCIFELLQKQDLRIFKRVTSLENHPLNHIIPKKKETSYNLRKKACLYPRVNTERFKATFINRLIFKYNVL